MSRKASKARRGWKSAMGRPLPVWLLALLVPAALACGLASEWIVNGFSGLSAPDNPLRINEVMTSNRSAVRTSYGETADYVEIVNVSDGTVSLEGCMLALAAKDKNYRFPAGELAPGETALVFCDDGPGVSGDGEYRAHFSLPASGCTVVFHPAGQYREESVAVPALEPDTAWVRGEGGEWEASALYTPGLPNTPENHELLIGERQDSPFSITEIMSHSASYGPAGLTADYVEIHNSSDEPQDISNWGLSDRRDRPFRWRFPRDTSVPAGGYILVYCMGAEAREIPGETVSTLSLSAQGEALYLSDPMGRLAQSVEFPPLGRDRAYTWSDGAWTDAALPTPGLPGGTQNADEADRLLVASNATGVTINEIMASPDDGKCDWVELYNSSSYSMDLTGWGFSDSPVRPYRWVFPNGAVIPAGGYLCVGVKEKGEYGVSGVSFEGKLSTRGGYILYLSDTSGVVDRVFVPDQYRGVSYGRRSGLPGLRYLKYVSFAAENPKDGWAARAATPAFSQGGGLYPEGETVLVEISAPEGQSVYYTLDCTEPVEGESALYTSPIAVSSDTVVRARAYMDGCMPGCVDTQTYLFGKDGGVRVVSVVADPAALYGDKGILDRPVIEEAVRAHVECFEAGTGETLLSQPCDLSLFGTSALRRECAALRLRARAYESGMSRFTFAPSGGEIAEYKAFLLWREGTDTVGFSAYADGPACALYVNGKLAGTYRVRY